MESYGDPEKMEMGPEVDGNGGDGRCLEMEDVSGDGDGRGGWKPGDGCEGYVSIERVWQSLGMMASLVAPEGTRVHPPRQRPAPSFLSLLSFLFWPSFFLCFLPFFVLVPTFLCFPYL